jgi:hypothetical protein
VNQLFVAYPANPPAVGQVIEAAVAICKKSGQDVLSWTAQDIIGDFISDNIFENISKRTLVVDTTRLNANVAYELGFAISQQKFILLVKNESIREESPNIQEVGIFDTLGYKKYQNSQELASILQENKSNQPFKGFEQTNLHAPIFIMDTQFKTDFSSRIINRVNVSGLYYRSFDPSESPRLSALHAIKQVCESYGVIVQMLGSEMQDSSIHNIRAAFIAGLARGIDIPCRIMQNGFSPVPIDFRDIVNIFRNLEDINEVIAEFVKDVVREMQELEPATQRKLSSLEKIDFGASAAENEIRKLQRYYLPTDAFSKALRGEVQLILGRKGTGKSAIFHQLSNREKSSGKNVVLDLQPEGYKLIKFKEQVLDYLEEGSFQHTIMAFWEYLLALEVAHKILESDKARHKNSDKLRDQYVKLQEAYKAENHLTQGDFSERMTFLMDRLQRRFNEQYIGQQEVRLSNPEVTNLIHQTNIKGLKEELSEYLKLKDKIWVLFDNIDKGWPASGLTHHDLLIIRSLIEAAQRLHRYFDKSKLRFYPIIFLRSDVYHQLLLATSDRQKESKVSLDWVDRDLLTRVVELRLIANQEEVLEIDFIARWRSIAESHVRGEDSFQFMLDRCLMRPRFLINFLNHSKSYAVNLNHDKIMEEDVLKGYHAYSSDVLEDMELEIRDVFPNSKDIISVFYGSSSKFSSSELTNRLSKNLSTEPERQSITEVLLLYGFLGICDRESTTYIFDVGYNISLLRSIENGLGNSVTYSINPAFWPALRIS